MKSAYPRVTRIGAVLLSLALLAGCPVGGRWSGQARDVTLTLTALDYENRAAPENAVRSLGRIIDPATDQAVITVTGPDIAEPIVSTTLLGWYWDESSGQGSANCTVSDVPLGLERTILVETFDATGDPLTSGSVTTSIDMNTETYFVRLHPANAPELVLDTPQTPTLAKGRAMYFALNIPSGSPSYSVHYVLVTATSADADVDLYASDVDYDYPTYSRFQEAPPSDEGLVLSYSPHEGLASYVWAYAPNTVENPDEITFTIQATILEARNLDAIVFAEVAPGAYTTIEGTATASWDGGTFGAFQEIELGFTFVYLGRAYTKVYVSPNGYLSFWRHRLSWYPWSQSVWGLQLPNEVVALFNTGLSFYADATAPSSILYKGDTTMVDGEVRQRLVVEYKNMYAVYGGVGHPDNRRVSGQIVLVEGNADWGETDPMYGSGTVELKYDRASSNMTGVTGYAGLENDVGWHVRSSFGMDVGSVAGVPIQDRSFAAGVGNIGITIQD